MKIKYKKLFKDTAIFAIGSLGSKIILFLLVPLYTNFLTTEEYGIADLVSSFGTLIIPLVSLVINEAVIRFGMKKIVHKEDVLKNAFIILLFSTLMTFLSIPIFSLYNTISKWKYYLCGQIIINNFLEVEKSYLKVKDKNKLFAISGILQTLILAISNIILIVFLNFGIKGYLMSNLISAAFSTILIFLISKMYKDLKKGKVRGKLLKQMVKYSSPLILANISWWIIHASDKIMIEMFIGASALGVYTVASKIPSLINVLISIFNQAWGISSIKEKETSDDQNFYSTVFELFQTVIFTACLLCIIIIKPFMNIYVGTSFKDAWQYIPFLLVAAVFFSIAAFIGSLYSAQEKTINNMITTIICAITNIIINYFGIINLGLWGAILGTLISYFVYATFRIIDIKRYIKLMFNIKRYSINLLLILIESLIVSFNIHIIKITTFIIGMYIINNRAFIKELIKRIKKTDGIKDVT